MVKWRGGLPKIKLAINQATTPAFKHLQSASCLLLITQCPFASCASLNPQVLNTSTSWGFAEGSGDHLALANAENGERAGRHRHSYLARSDLSRCSAEEPL